MKCISNCKLIKKDLIVILIVLICIIFISFKIVYFIKYLSHSKYNIRPAQIIENYLKETYGGKYSLISTEYYVGSYHIWKLKYKDESGMIFYQYYIDIFDSANGLNYWLDPNRGEIGIRDYYWQTKLREIFEKELHLSQYEYAFDRNDLGGSVKYIFDIASDSEMSEVVGIISKLYSYTYEHVKKPSYNVINCQITYQGRFLCNTANYYDEFGYKNGSTESLSNYIRNKIDHK